MMLCADRDSLRQERGAAAHKFRAAIRDIVALVDTSGTESDLHLAHRRIRAARFAYEKARDALEHHQCEHRC